MPYHYKECGLPNIYLLDGFDITLQDGEEHIAIHALDSLHKQITYQLTKASAPPLAGGGIRFLRTELGQDHTELARILNATPEETVTWELGQPIPYAAEALLRLYCLDGSNSADQPIRKFLQVFAKTRKGKTKPLYFTKTPIMGWSHHPS